MSTLSLLVICLCTYNLPHTQRRGSLPLATLKAEQCPQISAHDLIMLCRLESQAVGYENLPRTNDSDLFRKKGGVRGPKKSRQKAVVVDIRTTEEFRLGHIPNSISIPETLAFQADGSLVQTQSTLTLTTLPKGRVIIVVGGKKENVAVVGLTHFSRSFCSQLSAYSSVPCSLLDS